MWLDGSIRVKCACILDVSVKNLASDTGSCRCFVAAVRGFRFRVSRFRVYRV